MTQEWIGKIAADGNRREAAAQKVAAEKAARRDAEVPRAEQYWQQLWTEIARAVGEFNEATSGRYGLVPSKSPSGITVKRPDATGKRDASGAALSLDIKDVPFVRGTHPGHSSPDEFQAKFQFDDVVTLEHKTPAEYAEWLLTPVFEAAIDV
jgi:hypothetical protein